MNYIKHLNAVLLKFSEDSRLNPTHISMYLALFQFWNLNRFSDEFYIDRQETMQLSKIGSKTTYHRCLKNLSDWQYIKYLPSHNPFKGSRIKMAIFRTSTGTSNGQAVVSNINSFKPIQTKDKLSLESTPKNEDVVLIFFKEKGYPELEALKFYNHYQGVGWKIGGKVPIMDWQATANNWMLKADNQEHKKYAKTKLDEMDYLKTNTEKNYSEPL